METWRYFHLTHRYHRFCNPTSAERIDELGRLLGLTQEKRLLDLACGMGEVLLRWAETYGCTGVGVDLSPYAIRAARERHAARLPDADLAWVHKDAAEFATGKRFDVALSIGASWIWKGFEGTLSALRSLAREGGLIVSGEPYWREEPDDPDLEELRDRRRRSDESYLRWGRHCLGFALWAFRVPRR